MATIKGRVVAGTRGIAGLLVEAFHVDRGFAEKLPLKGRDELADQRLKRLGSTRTSASGDFVIDYNNEAQKRHWIGSARKFNIWLATSSCCDDTNAPVILHQAQDIRYGAAETEEYVISLPEDYEDANNNSQTTPDARATPELILASYDAHTARAAARKRMFAEQKRARDAIKKDFRTKIAPVITKRMSLVERAKDGKPLDGFFVESGASVRKVAETKLAERVSAVLSSRVGRSKRLSLRGRLSLTPAQVATLKSKKIEAESGPGTFAVAEKDLSEALIEGSGSGLNPEADAQIVNRVDAIKQFCRTRTKGEICLDYPNGSGEDTTEVAGDGITMEEDEGDSIVEFHPDHQQERGRTGGDSEAPLTETQQGDNEDLTGQNVTLESLRSAIPGYVANVLNEQSVLDPINSPLPAPGARLSEDAISAAGSFPSLTLPPGPADVPAFFDFYDLQIAFGEVWQEALDDALIGDIEAIYEKYVEAGGTPEAFVDVVFGVNGTFLTGQFSNPIDVGVQRHVEIDAKEWEALNTDQQSELSDIADEIDARLAFLYRRKLQDNEFDDGLTEGDLNTFNRTKEYVTARVEELRAQAGRIVTSARKELERQAAGKSIVPNNAILAQLRSRLMSAYPAKYFAANRVQRSVNFGLMLTYRQRWTPTAYQVGELIKSIPLAPKEVRKYSKKTVRKQRRARKEVENNLDSLKSETTSTTRAEAEIVQDAMNKTNFNASAKGSFTVGVWSGGGSSSLTQDASSKSAETKKRVHEAVVKAAREYRNEIKVELDTEETFEEEFQESGEIVNPNDELTVTYLFYELQRRYRVEERLHQMTSVVLVAQEMPRPSEIDEDWLIAHRWILNRVMLDDRLKGPLNYVADSMVAQQFALEEARKTLEQQRRLVEELKEDVSTSRILTESRYAALQRSMERSARATQRKSSDGGGLFGFARKLTAVGVVGDLVDRFIGGESEAPEAARVREAAAQDAYQREMNRLLDLEAQLGQMNASLGRATEEFADRLGAHLANVVQVHELRNHIKDNITHYMQAIWMHEPFQQRWLRLKDVPVPVLRRGAGASRLYRFGDTAAVASLANVAHLGTATYDFEVWPEIEPPDLPNPTGDAAVETVPLYQVADIDDLIGFRANYMIFPMRQANALTDFMMEPYVERAAGGFGITDPDDLGNMNLDDFGDYICCLKKKLSADNFAALGPQLRAQLKKLLQSPLRDDEEIVVPMDAMYIEALPGARPILEDFKLLHRQIDAADAQENLRLKKMEKLRYAQRLLDGRTDDPAADARYEFTGNPDMDFAIQSPGGNGGDAAGG